MGNNDPKYHYQGIDPADKADFYGMYLEHWFTEHPFNAHLVPSVKDTLMFVGYYRVDVDDNLSILAVNTLYLNKKNNDTWGQTTEGTEQIAWMRDQLSTGRAQGRKFLITTHIYPGAKYDQKSKNLFTPDYNEDYFSILSDFRDVIVLESCAHDHYADVRYHSSGDTVPQKYFFHNLLVAPGVTPIDGSNPGFAVFELDAWTLSPQNLVLHYLPLEQTYGWKSVPADVTTIPFRRFQFSDYGLTDFSADSLSAFQNALKADDNLTYKYLVGKVGFNPDDSKEFEQGMSLYINDLGIITANARKTYKFICQMHLSKDKTELDLCIANNKAAPSFLNFE